ncbi:hypothetical protein [Caldicellulosiruptor naganoensis]|uniref:Uncharacterized protein n=1 Tax=Caldicellulosiruptor naganoensis TaxID=29324 RepID=A0ABY7BGN0_9FIRM|nr:hypothetical protein [Caldicellulosiruptor naganoensis]WAM31992.1 hypothetical protein OTJ99_000481 [Caldicellulosiruptor naganoensis]
MSLVHYIAANKELPVGNFGLKQSRGEERKKLEKFYKDAKNKPKATIFELIDLTNLSEDEIEIYQNCFEMPMEFRLDSSQYIVFKKE